LPEPDLAEVGGGTVLFAIAATYRERLEQDRRQVEIFHGLGSDSIRRIEMLVSSHDLIPPA
jgi:beta-lactamase superfamily II metal-dependent hydrolase